MRETFFALNSAYIDKMFNFYVYSHRHSNINSDYV